MIPIRPGFNAYTRPRAPCQIRTNWRQCCQRSKPLRVRSPATPIKDSARCCATSQLSSRNVRRLTFRALPLALCLLPAVLTACGGGGGGTLDVTPPTIPAIAINPAIVGFAGGQVEVIAQVSDDRDPPARLSVQAELVLAANSQSVTEPTTLTAIASNTFSSPLTVPPNDSVTGTPDNYLARVVATDSSGNASTAEGGSLTVQAIQLPPPPPP